MNKKRGIIIGIFALVVTMIIGYAYFSKDIEIKGTATASGNFDLSYECAVTDDSGNPTDLGTCTIKGNVITTASTLTKPTDVTTYTVTITNAGTIPATLTTIESPNNYDINKIDEGKFVVGDSVYVDQGTMLSAYYGIFHSSNICSGDSETEAAKITILPGERLSILIYHVWVDSDLFGMQQPKLPEGGATMEYNMTLGFEQANS